MNRRQMFGAMVGASSVAAVPTIADSSGPAQFAFARVTTCAVCDNCVIYLDPSGLLRPGVHLVKCGSPQCQNRWPWIQEGTKQTRVSAKVKSLVLELEDTQVALSTAQWDRRNAERKLRQDVEWRDANNKAEDILQKNIYRLNGLIAKELA